MKAFHWKDMSDSIVTSQWINCEVVKSMIELSRAHASIEISQSINWCSHWEIICVSLHGGSNGPTNQPNSLITGSIISLQWKICFVLILAVLVISYQFTLGIFWSIWFDCLLVVGHGAQDWKVINVGILLQYGGGSPVPTKNSPKMT